jgi:ABC-type Fe3+/spermidine/putrescine transport system ATPase subunit
VGRVQGRQLNEILSIAGLTVRFGPVTALDRLDLSVRRGEFFVLLGGSGSGKTTLLRAIGGFVTPDAGSIVLGGLDLAHVPPHRRPVNTVFQSGSLFPHLSVAANIGFGPRQRGMARSAVATRVDDLLALVRLQGYGKRRPHELSGGQQQRVALARALAAEPSLLLLDEPLSALDRGLRAETAAELVRLQRQLGTTFIQVTHDQQEALTMADRIGVMRMGSMAQVGTPPEIYERPVDRFVAEFMGVGNLWDAIVRPDGLTVDLPEAAATLLLATKAAPGPIVLGVRAERIRMSLTDASDTTVSATAGMTFAGSPATGFAVTGSAAIGSAATGSAVTGSAVTGSSIPGQTIPGSNQLSGELENTVYAGNTLLHSVRLRNGIIARVAEPAHDQPLSPAPVTLTFAPSACMVLPR